MFQSMVVGLDASSPSIRSPGRPRAGRLSVGSVASRPRTELAIASPNASASASPGNKQPWSASSAYVVPTPHRNYNMTLAEMIEYSDRSLVLVLEEATAAEAEEEAEYPIDIDVDTSALLTARESDQLLSRYAEFAASLVQPPVASPPSALRDNHRDVGTTASEHARRGRDGVVRRLFPDEPMHSEAASTQTGWRDSERGLVRDASPPEHSDRGDDPAQLGRDGKWRSSNPSPSDQRDEGQALLREGHHRAERDSGSPAWRHSHRSSHVHKAPEVTEEEPGPDNAGSTEVRSNGDGRVPYRRDSAPPGDAVRGSSGSGVVVPRPGWARRQGRVHNGATRSAPKWLTGDGAEHIVPSRDASKGPVREQRGALAASDGADALPAHSGGEVAREASSPTDGALVERRDRRPSAEAPASGNRALRPPEPLHVVVPEVEEEEEDAGEVRRGSAARTVGLETGAGVADSEEEELDISESARSFSQAALAARQRPPQPMDYATRRSSTPTQTALRRSSRRTLPAHARVRMDTSNLATYNLPTLRCLARDLGMAGYQALPKELLVPELMTAITAANRALGAAPVCIEPATEVRRAAPRRYRGGVGSGATGLLPPVDEAAGVVSQPIVDSRLLRRWRRALDVLREQAEVWSGNASMTGTPPPPPPPPPGSAVSEREPGEEFGRDVGHDFETLASLSMDELQTLSRVMEIEESYAVPKHEVVSRLLSAVYGLSEERRG